MVQDSDEKALPEGSRSRLEQREKVLDCGESFPFIARRKGLAELFEVRLEEGTTATHFVQQSSDGERAVFRGFRLSYQPAQDRHHATRAGVHRNAG